MTFTNLCAEIDLSQSGTASDDPEGVYSTGLMPWHSAAYTGDEKDGCIGRALNDIWGIALRHVELKRDIPQRRNRPGALTATITFSGWSPSLHLKEIKATGIAEDGIEWTALNQLLPVLQRQHGRAAEAQRRGFLGPLTGNGMEFISHLMVDRLLVHMHQEDPTYAPIFGQLVKAVKASHETGVVPHDGGPSLASLIGVVAEYGRPGKGMTRIVGARTSLHQDPAKRGQRDLANAPTFDGALVTVPSGELPETMLASMVGREVGAVARIHPLLDQRVITQAHNSRDGKRVVLATMPEPVPITDL